MALRDCYKYVLTQNSRYFSDSWMRSVDQHRAETGHIKQVTSQVSQSGDLILFHHTTGPYVPRKKSLKSFLLGKSSQGRLFQYKTEGSNLGKHKQVLYAEDIKCQLFGHGKGNLRGCVDS